ncbi:MAG: hypothetical protein IT446_01400 [Phycisphaerales bacterium]|nr:hypothetical protein [Phycisphaerales bacterium]
MQADQIPPLLLRRMGLRIGPQMARYICDAFNNDPSTPLCIIGGDARTGLPARQMIQPVDLEPQANQP